MAWFSKRSASHVRPHRTMRHNSAPHSASPEGGEREGIGPAIFAGIYGKTDNNHNNRSVGTPLLAAGPRVCRDKSGKSVRHHFAGSSGLLDTLPSPFKCMCAKLMDRHQDDAPQLVDDAECSKHRQGLLRNTLASVVFGD